MRNAKNLSSIKLRNAGCSKWDEGGRVVKSHLFEKETFKLRLEGWISSCLKNREAEPVEKKGM